MSDLTSIETVAEAARRYVGLSCAEWDQRPVSERDVWVQSMLTHAECLAAAHQMAASEAETRLSEIQGVLRRVKPSNWTPILEEIHRTAWGGQ